MPSKREIETLVRDKIKTAIGVADHIGLIRAKAAVMKALEESAIADVPSFKELPLGTATKLWAAVLFMDMRDSSGRALRVGARDTYVTMHALLPLMAFLVNEIDGYIVGFRGDGLFGAFGINAAGDNDGMEEAKAVQTSCVCGQTVVEAVEKILNPVLDENDIEGDVEVGAGVDIGEIVITRIGLQKAHEITAYGNAVNHASRLAGQATGSVLLSSNADRIYPSSERGKVTTTAIQDFHGAYEIHFPTTLLED